MPQPLNSECDAGTYRMRPGGRSGAQPPAGELLCPTLTINGQPFRAALAQADLTTAVLQELGVVGRSNFRHWTCRRPPSDRDMCSFPLNAAAEATSYNRCTHRLRHHVSPQG